MAANDRLVYSHSIGESFVHIINPVAVQAQFPVHRQGKGRYRYQNVLLCYLDRCFSQRPLEIALRVHLGLATLSAWLFIAHCLSSSFQSS